MFSSGSEFAPGKALHRCGPLLKKLKAASLLSRLLEQEAVQNESTTICKVPDRWRHHHGRNFRGA
jgi:hypothetical protein